MGPQRGRSIIILQTDTQTKDRETSCLDGLDKVVSSRVTTKKRLRREKQTEFDSEVSRRWSPRENATGDQNQKTAISSQMALTLNGFEQMLLVNLHQVSCNIYLVYNTRSL